MQDELDGVVLSTELLFDPVELERVRKVLGEKGKSDDDIEAMLYYSFDYFRERVRRIVPPPSIHYKRVRAVFETFGPLRDAKTAVTGRVEETGSASNAIHMTAAALKWAKQCKAASVL